MKWKKRYDCSRKEFAAEQDLYSLIGLQVEQAEMESLDKIEPDSFLVSLSDPKCFDLEGHRYLTEWRKERCFLEVNRGLARACS